MNKKQIDREMQKEINNEFSKEDLTKLLISSSKEHIKLVKWLYDNHRDILRKYEKTRGKLQIHFAGGKDGSKNR